MCITVLRQSPAGYLAYFVHKLIRCIGTAWSNRRERLRLLADPPDRTDRLLASYCRLSVFNA